LIAATIPFWPAPKSIAGWSFSLYEMLIWVAVVVRGAWCVVRGACAAFSTFASVSRAIQHALCSTLYALRSTLYVPRRLDWPILALLAVGLLSTLAAERSDVAWREFRTVFLDAALFYWLITRTLSQGSETGFLRRLVNGLLLGMTIVSLLGLWQLATGQGRVDVEGVWRVRGLYGSPNNLALVLDRIVPLALALAAFGTSLSFGYAIVTLVTVVACLATFSKGALLLGLPAGVAVVLLGGAWRARKRWPLWALAGLAVAAVVSLAFLLRTPRFADLFNFQAGTGFFRLKLWQGAWQMGLDRPWLGVGPDNFLYAYRTRYVLPSAWQELNLSHPHNLFLDLWTRLGIAGLLAGGWAIVSGFRRGWYLLRSAGAEAWPLVLGLLGGLAATVAHGLIDNSLFLVDLMALFVLALGIEWRMANSR
jgi:O-antigen ligase